MDIKAIQTVLGYIDINITEDISLEDLAKKANYSMAQFYRIFTLHMDISPMEYVNRRKLYFAAAELILSNKKIIDIAFSYAFKSHDVFIRTFKRYYGISPSAFRNLDNIYEYYRKNSHCVSNFAVSLPSKNYIKGEQIKMSKTKVHQIPLQSLVPSQNGPQGFIGEGTKTKKLINSSNELVIADDGDIYCLQTAENYTLPLRIDMTAKTNSTNIRLYYYSGEVIFNWECNPDELRFHDILWGNNYGYSNQGKIPENEYVDISWVIEKRFTEIYVNGELRHRGDSYPYIGLLMLDPKRTVSEPVRISAAWGSTVTVKSLTITELE